MNQELAQALADRDIEAALGLASHTALLAVTQEFNRVQLALKLTGAALDKAITERDALRKLLLEKE